MHIMSAEASGAFTKRVILPLAALASSLLVCAIGGVFAVAEYQTEIAIREQGHLARNGLAVIIDKLETGIRDYGRWDEALAAATVDFDYAWLRKNIGVGSQNSFHTEGVFVLDAEGRTLYSRIAGSMAANRRPRCCRPNSAAGGSAGVGRRPMPPSAVSCHSGPGRRLCDIAAQAVRGCLAAEADRLRAGVYRRARPRRAEAAEPGFRLFGFREVDDAASLADPRASIQVTMPEGSGSFRFAWNPIRPGDDLLRLAIPFLLVFIPILMALGIVLLRYVIVSVEVISDREKKAFSDPLTGLANRAGFLRRLDKALQEQARGGAEVSVMYIDLDGFKQVNDTMGHGAGDQMLMEVGARFRACVGQSGEVARLGGDEFAVVFTDGSDRAQLQASGARMLIAMNEPFYLAEGIARASCSIGIALCPGDGANAADLLGAADHALYEAKSSGKNAMRFADHQPAPPLRRIA